ncbi:MAG: hypothetical protein JRN20_14630 [Nitrososphaerota archaeon]|nr:hypothetical protein [Nitrososphaerota archaeon]MDG6923133.1 hypothetical protein [Nitrososphaerota archaeon]
MTDKIYTPEFGLLGQAILYFLRPEAVPLWIENYHSPDDFIDSSIPGDCKLWNIRKNLSKEQNEEQFNRKFSNGIYLFLGEMPKNCYLHGNEAVHFDIGYGIRQGLIESITYLKTEGKATKEDVVSFIVDVAETIADEIRDEFEEAYIPILRKLKDKREALESIERSISEVHQRTLYDQPTPYFTLHPSNNLLLFDTICYEITLLGHGSIVSPCFESFSSEDPSIFAQKSHTF